MLTLYKKQVQLKAVVRYTYYFFCGYLIHPISLSPV